MKKRLVYEKDVIEKFAEMQDLRTLSTATIGKVLKACPTVDPVKPEWISVKDRLPEQYSFVLSFNGLGVGEAFFDGWRFLGACKDEILSTTHWMPLPEPPKGEEK